MWLIHFIPAGLLSFIIHTLLVLGVVGVFISFFVINKLMRAIPKLASYHHIAQISSVIILTLGVYLKGAHDMEMAYRDKVADLEKQLEVARQESAKVNTVIKEKIIYRNKIITEQGQTIIEKVDNFIPVEKDCSLPKEAIDIHNEAARMNKAIQELRKGDKK